MIERNKNNESYSMKNGDLVIAILPNRAKIGKVTEIMYPGISISGEMFSENLVHFAGRERLVALKLPIDKIQELESGAIEFIELRK